MPKYGHEPPIPPPPSGQGGLLLLIQDDPLIWLCSLDLPTEPPSKFRLAAYPENIYFESDSTGAGVLYYAGAFALGELRADTEASTPTTKLTAQNLSRELSALVESYDLTGQTVRMVLIQFSELPNGSPIIDDYFEVLECDTTEGTVELTLGLPGMLDRELPDRRITRDHCAHDFGGPECGYDTKAPLALQTCSKIEDGELGCKAHSNQARFLGFKGVPRMTGTGAT